jgi:hypothetical protein
MPKTAEDVENYLLQLDRRYESDAGTLLVQSSPDRPPIAIRVAAPIVAIRVDIGPVPADERHQVDLFRRLLEYNVTDLMHASYGLEQNTVVLAAALELENLDKNELEATLSDMDLALSRHVGALKEAAQA